MAWLNLAAFVATLAINGLAGGTTLIGGRNTAQVSNLYPSLITPPGYTFAIWGVIYLLLLLYIIFQALPSQRNAFFQREVGYLFAISCGLNVAWLFLWQNDLIPLSLVLIVLLLVSLGMIYFRLNADNDGRSLKEMLFVNLGFSAYFAWICIATIADAAALLVFLGFAGSGPGAAAMTVIAAIVVLCVTLYLIVRKRDVGFALVSLWAISAIALKSGQDATVMIAGVAVCLVIATGIGATILKRGRHGTST
jgi:hypothetical protein